MRIKRNECRKLFNDNFSYKDIGSIELSKLKSILKTELDNFSNQGHWIRFYDSKKKNHLKFNSDGSIDHFALRCSGDWFDDREAITFNPDGFIGFAGWADDKNIIPFLKAFKLWILYLIERLS